MRNYSRNAFAILVLFCVYIIIFSGCSENNPGLDCSEKNMKNINYQDVFTNVGCEIKNIIDNNQGLNLVIKNKEDYKKYIHCNSSIPDVDFDSHMLLAVRYDHHQCAFLNTQKVQMCNNEKIIYTANISEKDCLTPTSIFCFLVLDKKYDTLPIEFNYQLKKE